tara:strand:- start:165 stop:449 length:285 start_codon:yes stop_codon:yes gene_type:complete
MRSVGIENSVTSLALTTHQANNEQYQRSADEAENFVNENTAPTASPPEEGPPPRANPQEANSRRTPAQEGVSTQSEPQENIQPQETGKNLDVRA